MHAGFCENSTPATRYLEERGIPYRFFRHSSSVRSLEQAASERGQKPEQIIRSILFRLPENEFVMVLIAGKHQIPWKALREYLGLSRLTTATNEEVVAVTGYPPGAVSPFGLPRPLRILADESIFEPDEVSLGSGIRNSAILLKQEHLRKALDMAERVNFLEAF